MCAIAELFWPREKVFARRIHNLKRFPEEQCGLIMLELLAWPEVQNVSVNKTATDVICEVTTDDGATLYGFGHTERRALLWAAVAVAKYYTGKRALKAKEV